MPTWKALLLLGSAAIIIMVIYIAARLQNNERLKHTTRGHVEIEITNEKK